MNMTAVQHIRQAVKTLNPKSVRELGERKLNIALYAATSEDYRSIEDFLLNGLSPARRSEAFSSFHRAPDPSRMPEFDLVIYDETVLAPRRALIFSRDRSEFLIKQVIESFEDSITLPLARTFPPFRLPYIERVVQRTSRENAMFSLATALPDVIPSLIELPWALSEFASDTAVLTTNQVKMAFLIAAASNREVGYMEQKREIATVIGGAFGWRALAKQLVGKIPFGGGLLPKAAIAYAATRLVGLSLERFYRLGYSYTRQERRQIYNDAFQHGKRIISSVLKNLRPDLWAKYGKDLKIENEPVGGI
jgi:hypothetical protein